MKRSISILAVFVGLVVLVPTATAGEDTSSTSAPTTETPVTQTPVTEVPVTTTPVTTTPATTVPATTTTVTDVPVTTTVPTTTTIPTTGTGTPCIAECIPETEECIGASCIPSAGGAYPTAVAGAGSLPFTGIEDMIAPILLALTVVLGGVVAWRWARLRESVAEAAQRARPIAARESRTGYAAAIRQQVIEHRARQVFTPRVA